jgi:hypothetical protein
MLVGTPALATIVATPAGAAPASARPAPLVSVQARPKVPSSARFLGAVRASKVVSGDVGLISRDPAGLKRYATEVSSPKSALYHQYLSLGAFDARFAPTRASVAAIESTLRAGGLQVKSVSSDGLLVRFTGSAAKVAATFHTSLAEYRLSTGREAFANTRPARLTSRVAPFIQTVAGLNNLVVPQGVPIRRSASAAKVKGPKVASITGAPTACRAASAIAAAEGGITYQQLAYAYGLDPLYKDGDFGKGQTVDILDLYTYTPSDIKVFDACYFGRTGGAKAYANVSATNVDGGAQRPDPAGGTAETTLDIESVQALAPQAKVRVFIAPTNYESGFLDDIAAMTDSTAKLESISYGECEELAQLTEPGYLQLENTLFEQAAAEGKTVLSSSADNGSDTCSSDSGQPVAPVLSASDPSSQPFVTSVGGTAVLAATDPPQQAVWNDGPGGAGGGGISDVWSEEAWQKASKVPGLNSSAIITRAEDVNDDGFCLDTYAAPGTKCRELPDVSALGSPNVGGIAIYLGGEWVGYGGTSLSTPLWAAMLADIDSTKSCSSITGGVGFVSPSLYAIASIPAEYAASFDDITIGNNDEFGVADGLFPATKGYDMATGLGTPKVTGANGARGLAYYLCAAPAVTAPTVTGLSPRALPSSASAATLTITGHGFFKGSSSDVAGVTIGAYQVPVGHYTVESNTSIVVSSVPPASLQSGNGGTGDGTGSYDVTVTLTGGETSAPGPNSVLIYYDAGAASTTVPVVAGTFPAAGPDAANTKVTIYGSGFTTEPVTTVTFGGVAAKSFTVKNDNRIIAVAPVLTSGTTDCLNGESPVTDVCQVQVRVGNASNKNVEGAIPPEYHGLVADESGTTGVVAAATEFDYEPAPHLSTINFAPAPPVASEAGGTEVTITGTGLGALGLEWYNVGPPALGSSFNLSIVSDTPTKLEILLPAEAPTTGALKLPVSVQTYGSPNQADIQAAPSNEVDVTYAPTPEVTSSSTGKAYQAGPTTGGTKLTIKGEGFADLETVLFTDVKYGFETTAYGGLISAASSTSVTLKTPATITGTYSVSVCTVSGCSAPAGSKDLFTFYLPGNPRVVSSTPHSGKAGTKVVIAGLNLGWVKAVYFGTTKARRFANGAQFFESGNPNVVIAYAPKGTKGKKVNIRVETLESLATGVGKSPVNTKVTFTYKS